MLSSKSTAGARRRLLSGASFLALPLATGISLALLQAGPAAAQQVVFSTDKDGLVDLDGGAYLFDPNAPEAVIDAGVTLDSSADGVLAADDFAWTIVNEGRLVSRANYVPVISLEKGGSVTIAPGASVESYGYSTIYDNGNGFTFKEVSAIIAYGPLDLVNNGTIRNRTGQYINSSNGRSLFGGRGVVAENGGHIVNGPEGTIEGFSTAVAALAKQPGESVYVSNSGLIVSGRRAGTSQLLFEIGLEGIAVFSTQAPAVVRNEAGGRIEAGKRGILAAGSATAGYSDAYIYNAGFVHGDEKGILAVQDVTITNRGVISSPIVGVDIGFNFFVLPRSRVPLVVNSGTIGVKPSAEYIATRYGIRTYDGIEVRNEAGGIIYGSTYGIGMLGNSSSDYVVNGLDVTNAGLIQGRRQAIKVLDGFELRDRVINGGRLQSDGTILVDMKDGSDIFGLDTGSELLGLRSESGGVVTYGAATVELGTGNDTLLLLGEGLDVTTTFLDVERIEVADSTGAGWSLGNFPAVNILQARANGYYRFDVARTIGLTEAIEGGTLVNGSTLTAGQIALSSNGVFRNEATANAGLGIFAGLGGGVLINSGTVTGQLGFVGGDGNDFVDNSGSIVAQSGGAAVDLGKGNDAFVLRTGASLTGALNGGAGSDIVILGGQGQLAVAKFSGFEQLGVELGGDWKIDSDVADLPDAAVVEGRLTVGAGGAGKITARRVIIGAEGNINANVQLLSGAQFDSAGLLVTTGTLLGSATGDGFVLRAGARLESSGADTAGTIDAGAGRDSLALVEAGEEDAAFLNFEALTVEAAADWRLSGTGSFAEETEIAGRLAAAGTLELGQLHLAQNAALLVEAGAAVAGGAPEIEGALEVAGRFIGRGVLTLEDGGSLRVAAGGSAELELAEIFGDLEVAGTLSLSDTLRLDASTALLVESGGLIVAPRTEIEGVAEVLGRLEGTTFVTGSGIVSGDGEVAGRLVLADGGAAAGALSVIGALEVQEGGVLAPGGSSFGALNVVGNLRLLSGAVLQVDIDGAGASDKLSVEGRGSIQGARLVVTELAPTLEEEISSVIVATTEGLVSDVIVEENLAFFEATTSVLDGDLVLTLSQVEEAADVVAGTPNQNAAAGGAISIDPAVADPALQDVLGNLLVLDEAEAAVALNTLSGDFIANVASASLLVERSFVEGLTDRIGQPGLQASGRGGALGLVQEAAGPLPREVEVGRFGAFTTVDVLAGSLADDNAGDTDYSSFGLTLGGDYAVTPQVLLGAALGFASTSVETADRGGESDATAVRLGAFGRWRQEAMSVSAVLVASFGSVETERAILVGDLSGVASGSTDSSSFAGALEGSYDFDVSDWRVTPFATLSVTSLTQSAFAETGGAGANLEAGEISHDSLRFGLGAAASRRFLVRPDLALSPEARLAWRHEFLETAPTLDARFAGAAGGTGAFTVTGVEAGAEVGQLGLGLTAEWKQQSRAFLDYQLSAGADQLEHAFSLGFRYSF